MSRGQNSYLASLTVRNLLTVAYETQGLAYGMLLPPLMRAIPGFEDFNGQQECLEMLKPGFGLKDAPRL